MNEELLLSNIDVISFDIISVYQKLSEEFIDKFSDKLSWYNISLYQKLSEGFIEKYKDKVHWEIIIKVQRLSEEFIIRNLDILERRKLLDILVNYQVLSDEFRISHNLQVSPLNWLYFDNAQKLERVSSQFTVEEGKVIAYKSARIDGYSIFNFQYKYEVDGEYECHADCQSNVANSFGLSAWTKDGALSYYDKGKLFKVEIDLADIACMTSEYKLRAKKLSIIEEL
jgi:hypothetical protein